MLSKKAKYAIKALIRLADHQGEPVRIADLARTEQIPPNFLELILLGLRNNGVLQSRKGTSRDSELPRASGCSFPSPESGCSRSPPRPGNVRHGATRMTPELALACSTGEG